MSETDKPGNDADFVAISAGIADRYAAQGNWTAAAKVYCELAAAHPTIALLHWNAAIGLERAGRPADAIVPLKTLVALEPSSVGAWRKLGQLYVRGNALAEAVTCYERLVALLPEDAETRAVLGRLLRLMQKLSEAAAHLEKAFALNPALPGVAADVAEQYRVRAQLAEASRIAEEALSRGPDPAAARVLAHCGTVRMQPRRVLACGIALMDASDPGDKVRGTLFAGLGLMLLPDAERLEARAALQGHAIFAVSPTGLLFDAIVSGDEGTIGRVYNQWPHRHGQYSSTAGMFYLKTLLAREGVTVSRRAARPVSESLSVRSLTGHGRLAHSIYNYLSAYFYCRHAGLSLETPDWQGHFIFELDEPLYRADEPWRGNEDYLALQGHVEKDDEPAESYAGSDIFSPRGDALRLKWRDEIHRRLQYRPLYHRLFAPHGAFLRERGATLVVVHLRYGDMVGQEAHWGHINAESCNQTLRDLWPTLDRPILYVASDDPQKAKETFASFSPLTLEDLPPIQPMLAHVLEFYVIGQAPIVMATRGGYAVMAAALGGHARQFYRSDATGAMQPSELWRA